nr:protein kinase [Ktedonobacteraceae bacterium]
MLALEGRQLGNYDVIRRIRAGGMGAVYEGRQRTAFDRKVAIKVILGNFASDRDMRRRFAREARTVARLHHPHILPLIEFGDEQGLLYLVMPFIEGGTLTSYLRRSLPDLHEVSTIYQQLLDAVEYAHDEGLIHRDIKSSNVLLEQRRSGAYVYLADFGLVRTSRQAELEQSGKPIPLEQVPGTPHYMAPEQTMGIVTTASDIYALGVLLYQMLTGELPYDDPDEVRVIQMQLYAPIPLPSDHDATIPVELSEVVQKAMAKRVEDRYASVAELRQDFLAAVQGSVLTTDEDDLPANDIGARPPRPVSTPLVPLEPPAPSPIIELRRVKPVAAPAVARGRQRNTDSVRDNRQRTTEPVKRHRKRFHFSIVATLCVPVLLLALLIVPRVLGMSLFPVGVPIIGADPTTTISVTPQSKPLQDTFLLTASPQAQNPDMTTRIIPDRQIPATATASRTTQTTGITSYAGVQATGSVLLVNSSRTPVNVPMGVIFLTTTGIEVETAQAVNVPARQRGQDGTVSAAAMAVYAGSNGNIPANALSTMCCDSISVSNPSPFSGGIDARQAHTVIQSDIDRVSSPLVSSLEQQVAKQITTKMHTGEVMATAPVYQAIVTSNNPVGTVADQVTVQVTVSTTISVYNRTVAGQLAIDLLNGEAAQTLGTNYQLAGTPKVDMPRVVEQGKNGVLYLSVQVHENWLYTFSPQQLEKWKQSIKGATSEAALAYLNEQTGIAAVQIHLPFGADHIPTIIDQIKIELMSDPSSSV